MPVSTVDTDLIARCKQGDDAAFQKLVSKYSNLVGSIAYNITGSVDVAFDIAQETFLKVFKNLESLDDSRKFKGWVSSITRTTCIDWLRKRKRTTVSLDKIRENGMEPVYENPEGLVTSSTNLEAEELREQVLQAIKRLPGIYQEIIMLRHLRQMSYNEISTFLGIPQATVESRLYRARLMLKDLLKDLYV